MFFTKIFSTVRDEAPFSVQCVGNFATFSTFFHLGLLFPRGDVIQLPFHYRQFYANVYAGLFPRRSVETSGLLVEKPNFSTFSTDFSTMVVHRVFPQDYA